MLVPPTNRQAPESLLSMLPSQHSPNQPTMHGTSVSSRQASSHSTQHETGSRRLVAAASASLGSAACSAPTVDTSTCACFGEAHTRDPGERWFKRMHSGSWRILRPAFRPAACYATPCIWAVPVSEHADLARLLVCPAAARLVTVQSSLPVYVAYDRRDTRACLGPVSPKPSPTNIIHLRRRFSNYETAQTDHLHLNPKHLELPRQPRLLYTSVSTSKCLRHTQTNSARIMFPSSLAPPSSRFSPLSLSSCGLYNASK